MRTLIFFASIGKLLTLNLMTLEAFVSHFAGIDDTPSLVHILQ